MVKQRLTLAALVSGLCLGVSGLASADQIVLDLTHPIGTFAPKDGNIGEPRRHADVAVEHVTNVQPETEIDGGESVGAPLGVESLEPPSCRTGCLQCLFGR